MAQKNGENIDVENLWGDKENGDDGIYYTGKDHHGKHNRGTLTAYTQWKKLLYIYRYSFKYIHNKGTIVCIANN